MGKAHPHHWELSLVEAKALRTGKLKRGLLVAGRCSGGQLYTTLTALTTRAGRLLFMRVGVGTALNEEEPLIDQDSPVYRSLRRLAGWRMSAPASRAHPLCLLPHSVPSLLVSFRAPAPIYGDNLLSRPHLFAGSLRGNLGAAIGSPNCPGGRSCSDVGPATVLRFGEPANSLFISVWRNYGITERESKNEKAPDSKEPRAFPNKLSVSRATKL